MNLQLQLNQVIEYIEDLGEELSKNLDKQVFKKRLFTFTTIIVSSIITVILGIKEITYGSTIALILSGLITVINGFDAYFNPNQTADSINRARIEMSLLHLELNFYKTKGLLIQEEIDHFKLRLFEILKTMNKEFDDSINKNSNSKSDS
jgi:nitric oxide reductase large subunit